MQKRNLEELNLLDDFLMGSVLSYPGIGPEVCRRMVSIILNREIKQIRIIPQKVYFGADTDKHGIRLDVYAEEKADDLNTVYDIEPDKDGRESLRLALPKRARFYHAKIDADSLASGEDYGKLKNVIVIFICPYDPFQLNRMVYTIKSCCVEEPDLVYEDGARTIFLYTKGIKGNPPAELQRLLQYLEDSREENAKDADLMAIHQMVQKVKHDREVSLEYMKIFERERLIREDGYASGKEDGYASGKEDGYASGKEAELVEIIRRKQQKGLSADDIAEWLELDKEYVEKVMKLLEENPDADDMAILAMV